MKSKKVIPIVLLSSLMVIVMFAFIVGFQQSDVNVNPKPEKAAIKTVSKVMPEIYGFPIDSFSVFRNKVKRNENLSSILQPHDVSSVVIDHLAHADRNIFDAHKIISGQPYCILSSKDADRTPLYFIYEKDPIDYVVLELKDSGKVYEREKPVTTKVQTASGKISSSLYQTLDDNNINESLAMELSEVYAWAIDFYHLQKGDYFKVIYKQKYVDDKPVGAGQIQAAMFNHEDSNYYAFYFTPSNKKPDYFDENGHSLRKAFLKAPLKFSRVSSHYSLHRFHPIEKRWKAHLGTDYAAPTGTPIHTVGDGVVIAAHYNRFNGNYVKVYHNSTYTTQYLHMSHIAKGIRKGVHVKQGQVIGYVGSTGEATGPHLCFRFWKNGKQVDPFKQRIPPSKPVPQQDLASYNKVKNTFLQQLDTVKFGDDNKQYLSEK